MFKDDDLRRLYVDHDFRAPRFGPELIRAFRKKVGLLAAVPTELELRRHKALRLEKLKGDRSGQHSIRLTDQWRLILLFDTDADGKLVVVVEVVDYH
ncbi:type II toxin-antitoxin system RelE/ParE family toxin [Saccharopolyspora gloriosae]|uniref:type II toxin-antitoxin system RelE/ParE family toxin n=1 Tax=Saccharopolyspora gloriosae TaxID=455344 RepID=UPI0031B5DCA0